MEWYVARGEEYIEGEHSIVEYVILENVGQIV